MPTKKFHQPVILGDYRAFNEPEADDLAKRPIDPAALLQDYATCVLQAAATLAQVAVGGEGYDRLRELPGSVFTIGFARLDVFFVRAFCLWSRPEVRDKWRNAPITNFGRWGGLPMDVTLQFGDAVLERARRGRFHTNLGPPEGDDEQLPEWNLPIDATMELAKGRVALPLPAADSGKPARHSPDFRSVHWYGADDCFTTMQAAIVKMLWQARENGTPDVGAHTLLEDVDAETGRLVDIFRGSPAWGTLIVNGATKGTKRLADPQNS